MHCLGMVKPNDLMLILPVRLGNVMAEFNYRPAFNVIRLIHIYIIIKMG